MVTKVAERNPQKLRQIGLNYDIANAKGIVDPTEEEQKQKDQKKKEAAEKKQKEKEEADKEKAEFEAWKKGEREDYNAWKKEKMRHEDQVNAKNTLVQTRNTHASEPEKKLDAATSAFGDKEGKPDAIIDESKDATPDNNVTLGAEEAKSVRTVPEAELVENPAAHRANGPDPVRRDDDAPGRASSRPVSRGRRLTSRVFNRVSGSVYGDEPAQEAGLHACSPADDKPKPWNAVCVLGLRVYSQDPEVSIKLVKPKNVEEGAILDVGGDTAAGATM